MDVATARTDEPDDQPTYMFGLFKLSADPLQRALFNGAWREKSRLQAKVIIDSFAMDEANGEIERLTRERDEALAAREARERLSAGWEHLPDVAGFQVGDAVRLTEETIEALSSNILANRALLRAAYRAARGTVKVAGGVRVAEIAWHGSWTSCHVVRELRYASAAE